MLTSATGSLSPRGVGRARPAGFTLVELMVAIALLGILSALILPEMRGTYGEAVLRAGSRDLVHVCALASNRAVSFNRLHRVALDTATGRFRVEVKRRSADGEAAFVPVQGVAGCQGKLDSRIVARIQAGAEAAELNAGPAPAPRAAQDPRPDLERPPDTALSFYPDGTADPAAIILRHQDGHGLALRLNPVTARVRVLALNPR